MMKLLNDAAVLFDSDLMRGAVPGDPVADVLGAIGAHVERTPGATYVLTRVVVQRTVTTGVVLNVYARSGIPVVGVAALQTRDDGRGETRETDSAGHAAFNWGAGSAFSAKGAGPFTVWIADQATRDEETKRLAIGVTLSDVVKSLGDFEGEHILVYLQFAEPGSVQPAPVPGKLDFTDVIAALGAPQGAFVKLDAGQASAPEWSGSPRR